MTPDRRLIGAALGLALLVAACSSSSAATPAASTAASEAPAASVASTAPTEAPATEAAATEAPSSADASVPEISLAPGNAADLEAMLPDTVGTMTITKTSYDYSSIPWASLGAAGASGSSDIEKVLKDNGKTLADVRFAMGIATNAGAAAMPTMVIALQIKGLDASKFAGSLDSSYASAPTITMGGKQVKGTVSGGYGTVTYTHDDVVFLALGAEADLGALIAALP
jgi:hypothetical protein